MGPAVSEKSARKRARTGCLTCRVRRRKCDEEKPQCRRCRLGSHKCQYGTRLSFLDKNAFTLPASDQAGDSTPSKTLSCRKLQFVESRPKPKTDAESQAKSPENTVTKPRDTATAVTATEDISTPLSQSTAQEYILDVGDTSHQTSTQQYFVDAATPSFLHPSSDQIDISSQSSHHRFIHIDPRLNETSPNTNAYETALDVLLSLGNKPKTPYDAYGTDNNPPETTEPLALSDIEALPEAFDTCSHAWHDPSVRLLRHYVYNIAPWLDTGDPDQTFRIQVSQLSLSTPAVLDAILGLSATSLLLKIRPETGRVRRRQIVQQEQVSAHPTKAIVAVLARVGSYMSMDPFSWHESTDNVLNLQHELMATAENSTRLELSISWLVLRLDLSWGLVHEQGITIPELLLHSVTSPSSRGWARDLLSYDQQPLLLCARALNYCFGNNDGSLILGAQAKVGVWRDIFNSLNLWYTNRPQDFKPVLELKNQNQQLFPLLLFTNRAAIMANQMYHAAMLLLMQHRPRTIASEGRRSTGMSPLRHAQMICGIGLNNDDQNSWDFPLVASFYLAAKNMSYVPQQNAILGRFEKLAAMTGWNLGTLSPQLREAWNHV